MNQIKLKEFNEKKNELFGLFSFDPVTQKRISGYGNLSYIHVVDEMIKRQSNNLVSIVVKMDVWHKIIDKHEQHIGDRISVSQVLEELKQ